MKRALALLLLAVLFFAVITGCSHTSKAPASAPAILSRRHGRIAPDFKFKDASGKVSRLSDFRGKTIVLNFWASWCPMCKLELPMLAALKQEINSPNFEILAVQLDNSTVLPKEIAALGDTVILAKDTFDQAKNRYQISVLPVTYALDSEGRYIFFSDPKSHTLNISVSGPRQWNQEETLRELRAAMEPR